MESKNSLAKVLLALAVPFVFLGLIDPLEGGIALIFALVMYLVAFSIKKTRPRKLLWIPFLAALVIGAGTLTAAILDLELTAQSEGMPPLVIFGLWAYRISVLVTLVGAGITAFEAWFGKPRKDKSSAA
jgi:hypothetical protein